jgi:chromosome segregation ATPase
MADLPANLPVRKRDRVLSGLRSFTSGSSSQPSTPSGRELASPFPAFDATGTAVSSPLPEVQRPAFPTLLRAVTMPVQANIQEEMSVEDMRARVAMLERGLAESAGARMRLETHCSQIIAQKDMEIEAILAEKASKIEELIEKMDNMVEKHGQEVSQGIQKVISQKHRIMRGREAEHEKFHKQIMDEKDSEILSRDRLITRLRNEIGELSQQCGELQNRLEVSANDLGVLNQNLSAAEMTKRTLQNAVQQQKDELKDSEERNMSLRNRLFERQHEVDMLRDKRDQDLIALQEQVKELNLTLKEKDDTINCVSDTLTDVKSKAFQTDRQNMALFREKCALEAEKVKVAEQLLKAETHIEYLKCRIRSSTPRINTQLPPSQENIFTPEYSQADLIHIHSHSSTTFYDDDGNDGSIHRIHSAILPDGQ